MRYRRQTYLELDKDERYTYDDVDLNGRVINRIVRMILVTGGEAPADRVTCYTARRYQDGKEASNALPTQIPLLALPQRLQDAVLTERTALLSLAAKEAQQ